MVLSVMGNKQIILRKGRLGRIKSGHPWIYKNQFLRPDEKIQPGDIISVIDGQGKFLGKGYYNPRSDISIRILTSKNEEPDENFFKKRIETAADKRKSLLSVTNAYRAVFSEADALPGLIVDVYADTAVFQILTLGMERFKGFIITGIKEILKPKYLYEKSSSPFRKLEGLKDLKGWCGEKGNTILEIFEGKAKFIVDLDSGHKTGFYLDQRKSRLAMENISKGRRTLDLFCYTGGFSISAALYGADMVRGVDIKEEWLELARKNALLNGVAEKTEFVKADAFSALGSARDSGEKFGLIIIDPPSFLKNRRSIASASKGYEELNLTAMQILDEDGVLATFSCSHNMPGDAFSGILKKAAAKAGKKITILKRCHQAEDHPIVRDIPETEYLKGYFLKINSI